MQALVQYVHVDKVNIDVCKFGCSIAIFQCIYIQRWHQNLKLYLRQNFENSGSSGYNIDFILDGYRDCACILGILWSM